MNRGRNYLIGWIYGLCAMALLFVLRRNGIIVRHGAFDYTLVIGTVILTFLCLPLIVREAKKKAVPAKKSDWLGYAVILTFLLALVGIGYVALR